MKTTKISGYTIELSRCDDSIQCYVERGKYHASLAALLDTGLLETHLGGAHQVNLDVIDSIAHWAACNGY